MKIIHKLAIGFLMLLPSVLVGQTVDYDYFDGEVYMKITSTTPIFFDTINRLVDIDERLPFIKPLVDEYQINEVHSSFYFSKLDALKRTFRIYFRRVNLVDQFISDLENLEEVEYAEKVPVMRKGLIPNDLALDFWGNVDEQNELEQINALDAWDLIAPLYGANGWVFIVDDAISVDHEDLTDNIIYEWDVASNNSDANPPNSNFDHGTHVAGCAAARTNNNIGVASIGFWLGIGAIAATNNDSTLTHGYEGIEWITANWSGGTPLVTNCSWGGNGYSATSQTVINNAYNNNHLVVAAAGNDTSSNIFYPAGYNHVVAVAAVDESDVISYFSNYGSWIDVSAPGTSIYSTTINDTYGNKQGTSMASPIAAGLFGLVRSKFPSYSIDDVVYLVKTSADDIDGLNPNFNGQLGSGRINALAALADVTCNGSINLGTSNYTDLKTESSGTITSANTIPNTARVMFDAANNVILEPGFKVSAGGYFKAFIDGCGGAKQTANDPLIHTQLQTDQFTIYPNPFTNQTTIELNVTTDETPVTVEIFDVVGKRVALLADNQSMDIGKHQLIFQTDKVAGNFYLARIRIGEEEFVEKIVRME